MLTTTSVAMFSKHALSWVGCAVPDFLEPSVPLGVCTQANTGRVGCHNLGLVGLGSPHALGPVEPSAFHVLIVVPTSPQLFVV